MVDQEILEDEEKPADKGNKTYIYIGLGILLIIALVIGIYYIFKILPSRKIEPSPSPTITEEIWKVKSQKNVNDFMSFWSKSLTSTNGEQYALKAKDLLSNVAQAKLETYKDSDGKAITKVSEQLSKFIGVDTPPKSIDIFFTNKIDEKNVENRAYLFYDSTSSQARVLVFNNISEGGIWLIDSVANKGKQTVESPKPSPSASSILLPSPTK